MCPEAIVVRKEPIGKVKCPEKVIVPGIEPFKKYEWVNSIPFPAAVEMLYEMEPNRVMVSNKRMDDVLVRNRALSTLIEMLPCWTSTMCAYEKPGKALDEEIVYTDLKTGITYVFPTGDAKGEKNVILVAEAPNYALRHDGKNRFLVSAIKVDALGGFPISDGWYNADPVHGIPLGAKVCEPDADLDTSGNPEARYLHRVNDGKKSADGKRVGPITRNCYGKHSGLSYDGRHVNISSKPWCEFGILMEGIAIIKPEQQKEAPQADQKS
jgi:hypothetical protein